MVINDTSVNKSLIFKLFELINDGIHQNYLLGYIYNQLEIGYGFDFHINI